MNVEECSSGQVPSRCRGAVTDGFLKGIFSQLECPLLRENVRFCTHSGRRLVVMSLKPGEDIGAEVHKLDQFFRVEEGEGKAVLDGIEHRIKPGFAVLVPAGTRHNIINGPSDPMKLYTLYAPPNHRDGVVHATKADAEGDKERSRGRRPNSYLVLARSDRTPASRSRSAKAIFPS